MTKALIIGGGIAGPATAMALQKAGLDPVIYEAYTGSAHGVGAFLSFARNGMDALRTLDLDQPVRELGFDTPAMEFYSGSGKRLGGLRTGGSSDGSPSMRTIKRADLYTTLREAAASRGIPIEYGKRLTDAATTDHGVRAAFADGTEAEGDLLIGADGIRSRTRTIIDPNAPEARYLGLDNAAGFVRGVDLPGPPGVMHMIFGRRCFFAWVKHPDGEVWWFANPPRPQEPAPERPTLTSEQWRALLIEMLTPDRSPAVRLIESTETILAGWPTYDFPSVPVWHRGRMALVGDAVHAVSPASGQGASMAIEDAVTMGKCLRDLPEAAHAFTAFEQERRPRVERVVTYGKRNGDQKAVGPVASRIRDLVLPLVFAIAFRNGTRKESWLFDHRIDWQTPVGVGGARVRHHRAG